MWTGNKFSTESKKDWLNCSLGNNWSIRPRWKLPFLLPSNEKQKWKRVRNSVLEEPIVYSVNAVTD